jgi:hypothetical protein
MPCDPDEVGGFHATGDAPVASAAGSEIARSDPALNRAVARPQAREPPGTTIQRAPTQNLSESRRAPQLIPVRHLNQTALARRRDLSPRTLERWRWLGQGPPYMKLGGHVAYRLEDVEAYEQAHLR